MEISSLLKLYKSTLRSYDEVLDKKGDPKPHWNSLFTELDAIGTNELQFRQNEIIQSLRENGVTYNVYETPNGLNRPWQLDPIPFLIEQREWNTVSKGLAQRAQLLNLILRDVYGPQKLIKDRIIPPELVYANSGFYRSCIDVKIPDFNQLVTYSADMARGPDGRMWVLDNRTQAPSGSAYALENRSVINKIIPELSTGIRVRKISPYFANLQASLVKLAKSKNETPSIVLLTPGPVNETYFEHAYLASYLGCTLVQGDDLVVRNGYVWMKSLDGLQKVDVILRRIDDEWCDPLELKEDSQLGVPGLLQSIRSGKVAVANPPGVGAVENHAYLAFMPAICRYFLQEELILPSVATWWCGQPKELKFVLENLEKLIIKKANRKQRFPSVYGRMLSKDELEGLRHRILDKPYEYVAQEEVSLSTTPALINGRIEPRLAALRGFLIGNEQGYEVMQGGLTRSSAISGQFVISNQRGGISKDTWIIEDETSSASEKVQIGQRQKLSSLKHTLPSRTAENLFWVGRYAERTLALATLLDTVINELKVTSGLEKSGDTGHLPTLLSSVTHLSQTYPGFTDAKNKYLLRNPYREIVDLIVRTDRVGSISFNLHCFLQSLRAVRDKWNTRIWQAVDLLEQSQDTIQKLNKNNVSELVKVLDRLQSRILLFYSLVNETMQRNSGFYLLLTGKSIEKSLSQITVLRSLLAFRVKRETEVRLSEILLHNYHLTEQYRATYKSQVSIEPLLDMILQDSSLPDSLIFRIERMGQFISFLPAPTLADRINPAQRAVLEASYLVKLAEMTELSEVESGEYRRKLDELLAKVYDDISSVSVSIANMYFSHTIIQHSLLHQEEAIPNI